MEARFEYIGYTKDKTDREYIVTDSRAKVDFGIKAHCFDSEKRAIDFAERKNNMNKQDYQAPH